MGSCTMDKADPIVVVEPGYCDTVSISYATDIEPIFQTNCSVGGCHDAGGAAGGYVLVTHADIDGGWSQVICAIKHESGCSPMPKFQPKLADSVIQKLDCWDYQGRPNN